MSTKSHSDSPSTKSARAATAAAKVPNKSLLRGLGWAGALLIVAASLGVGPSCKKFTTCVDTDSCKPEGEGDGDGGMGGKEGEASCSASEIECDGACVDPLTNNDFCGAEEGCTGGVACSDELECVGGECVACNSGDEDAVACGRDELGTAPRTCVEGQWEEGLCRHPDNMISAAGAHGVSGAPPFTCAVRPSGKVYCWGYGLFGQLGDGLEASSPSPVLVEGLTDMVAVSGGGRHACGLRGDGTVFCWGFGDNGRLGNGSAEWSSTPVEVSGLSGAVAVSVGTDHSCALDAKGAVWCWGRGASGQLGKDPLVIEESANPLMVTGLPKVRDVRAREWFTCAVTEDDAVYCWGSDSSLLEESTHEATLVERLSNVESIALGHTRCAILSSGGMTCSWYDTSAPEGAEGPLDEPRHLAVSHGGLFSAGQGYSGVNHRCAVLGDGTIECWGHCEHGQLGHGSCEELGSVAEPVPVTGIDDALTVSAGPLHTCAIRENGQVACWGSGLNGELGYGGDSDQDVPIPVTFPTGE